MATGRRYDAEPKLNISKVIAVVIALVVVLMLIISIVNSLNKSNKKNKKEEISVTTTYFSAYKDNKWGVIDNNGNEIITPQYDEMVIIPNKEKDLFFVFENQNYDEKTYTTKVLNKNKEEVLSQFTNVEPIQNSLNASSIWYEQDILKYKTDNGYKIINFNGEEISSSVYENVYSLSGVENSIIVEANGVKGLVNGSTNQIVLQCSYSDIQTLLPLDYSKGYIVTNTNNLKGIIDANSKIIFECKYEDIAHFTGNDRYYVKENGTWKVIDNQGNTVIENPSVVNIENDYLIVNNNGQYGILDITGKTIIEPSYQLIEPSFTGIFIAKKDDKFGLIDVSNNSIIDFKYTAMSYRKEASFIEADKENLMTDIIDTTGKVALSDVIISELNKDVGYIRVRIGDDYKYYNLKFEEKNLHELVPTKTLYLVKKDGKYGYENKEGKLVVDAIYDDATEQNIYGYCAIKQNGLWGSLKADGSIVVKPSINMDNNLVIDFISDWHLFEDSLINTYVK